ncbi:apolipoprotein N-acyltransferase [Sulfuricurvum sp. IAE1]|mgnify:FL=1|uniref:apolipoprotein N-acyltransferase n=1 Tax=Sulfuricurvum sp. IAE1 TaxID=2546102 RepID=UPI0010471A5F|nr:apolipoprotein N-acyltransferase [Sulfuricurvum sp. IAE1]TDA62970.1 apolipoprotein N-acyltransferase [Sulfuricurvum sp. IAE1]
MKLRSPAFIELLYLPLAIAASFSAFIYFEHFGYTSRLVNTIAALAALYGMLHAPRRSLPAAGFFIGLAWCYWIGFSFQYYGLGWARELVALGFGIVYLLFFGILGLSSNPFVRSALLFALTFVWPMDFNWMQPELIFVESYVGIHKWQFALVLAALAATRYFTNARKALPFLLILPALEWNYPRPPMPELKIKLVSTDISQDFKWQNERLYTTVQENFDAIDEAIAQGYDLVVLPESAFPLYLNHQEELVKMLRERSERIAILTGTLHEENGLNYNVAYFFDRGTLTVAKKTVLVPFGEYIPLPGFLREWVNREIFGGGSDFVTADKPTDFTVKGIRFRNAICYEATRAELYTPEVRYLIGISNNGWFKPSIEPTLQKLLIRFYARKNGTVVFHAANGGGTGIVY